MLVEKAELRKRKEKEAREADGGASLHENGASRSRGLKAVQWLAIVLITISLLIFGREVLYGDWGSSDSGCGGGTELQGQVYLDICVD